MLRELFRLWSSQLGFEVVAEAKNTQDCYETYIKVKPNVLLLDIRFDEAYSGFDVARKLLKVDQTTNIVFISQFDQGSYVAEAYKLGGMAFISKNCDIEVFEQAIRDASVGKKYYMVGMMERVMDALNSDEVNPKELDELDFKIFMLLADGKKNSEVGEILGIDPRTVSVHRQQIQAKLKIDRLPQFTKLAIKYGLLRPI